MSHNKETKQAWVITVAKAEAPEGVKTHTDDMPIVVLHKHPNLLKYIMSFEDDKVTTQQFIFGGSMKTTADLDSSLMLDQLTIDKPELLEKPISEFTSPLMFTTKLEAEEARDTLLENQEIYRKGLLVEYVDGNYPTNLDVVNIYDLYEILPEPPKDTSSKNDNIIQL